MAEIITLRDISKRFGGVVALNQVSLGIEEGEIHAVVGENGAGKSTLMRILSGVLTKDSGSIFLHGVEKTFGGPIDAQGEGMSTVYQEPSLVPDLTVAENVFLGREVTKRFGIVDFALLNSRTEEILAALSLNIRPTALLRELSPAEIQLVQIARAIAFSTTILILDEPTASLTEHEAEMLFNLLKKLNKDGLTIIYVSHRLREVFDFCSRATVLRDGHVAGTVDIAASSESEIIWMMIGTEVLHEVPSPETVRKRRSQLEVRGLTVTQAPVRIKNCSFYVRSGEIVGLAGLVGSGRSEVAKALFGLNKIDAGEILIGGRKVEVSGPEDAVRLGMALVPEDRRSEGLIPFESLKHNISLTGLHAISVYGVVRGTSETDVAARTSEKLSIRAPSVDAEVSTLSGGNQQKAVLAKWLWLNPSILILDEPTRGIDVGAKIEIHNLIVDLAHKGASILIISSELPEILKLADRIYVIRDGEIVGELERSEASQESILRLAAVGN